MFSTGLRELVLIVDDVYQAAAFYRDVVRLTPETDVRDDWAWFWLGGIGGQRLAVHKGSLPVYSKSGEEMFPRLLRQTGNGLGTPFSA